MTTIQRTTQVLRKQGKLYAIVQHWNPHAKVRQDLLRIIDVLVLDGKKLRGIQCCGSDLQPHIRKITQEYREQARQWLMAAGTTLEIWSWRKLKKKRGGKARVWKLKVVKIKLYNNCDLKMQVFTGNNNGQT